MFNNISNLFVSGITATAIYETVKDLTNEATARDVIAFLKEYSNLYITSDEMQLFNI